MRVGFPPSPEAAGPSLERLVVAFESRERNFAACTYIRVSHFRLLAVLGTQPHLEPPAVLCGRITHQVDIA